MLCASLSLGNAQRFLEPIFNQIKKTNNIQYGSATNYLGTNENLMLNVYEPVGDTASKRPLIIYIHGGGFIDKNQSKDLVHIVAFCDSFARRGYTIASINYRLDSAINNRAIINPMHDAKGAIRFLRKNASTYKIDPSVIFIGGESAGAITSLTASYIDKAAEVNYPTTLPNAKDRTVEGNSGSAGFSSKTNAVLCLCGGEETSTKEKLFDTSAIESKSDAPLLFVHGTKDAHISILSAVKVAKRAEHLGIGNLF